MTNTFFPQKNSQKTIIIIMVSWQSRQLIYFFMVPSHTASECKCESGFGCCCRTPQGYTGHLLSDQWEDGGSGVMAFGIFVWFCKIVDQQCETSGWDFHCLKQSDRCANCTDESTACPVCDHTWYIEGRARNQSQDQSALWVTSVFTSCNFFPEAKL